MITTLLDAQTYPVRELASRYGERWQVETCFRHLKQTMRMDVLKCRTVDGVKKEVWMYTIIYNLVRAMMVEAGLRQGVPPEKHQLHRCAAVAGASARGRTDAAIGGESASPRPPSAARRETQAEAVPVAHAPARPDAQSHARVDLVTYLRGVLACPLFFFFFRCRSPMRRCATLAPQVAPASLRTVIMNDRLIMLWNMYTMKP